VAKAISYIRFSSAPQGKGSTTERQNQLIQNWFDAHPNVERSSLSQQDLGISAFRGTHLNHGLGRILQAVEQNEISGGDYILVEAIDRIGRLEPFEMVELIQRIVANGVIIVTLEDGQVYSRDSLNNEMASLFILIGKIQQAHQYSQSLSKRISAAYERKRRKARKGQPIKIATSFWLTSDGKIDPKKGPIVKKCIELYLKGYGHRRIILTLRDTYPILADVHPSTLRRWFKHRSLIGEWPNGDDPIPGVFEPLIDLETFYLLQSEMAERSRRMSPEQTYDLSGIVVCSRCDGRFYYRRKKHRDYTIIYANCSTYLKRGKPYCDNNRTWAYEVLRSILQFTMEVGFQSVSWDSAIASATQKVKALKQRKSETNDSIERLLNVLSQVPDQQNTIDRLRELEDAKQAIDKEIRETEAQALGPAEPSEERAWANYEDAMELATKLAEDPIQLRETLKRSGYRIVLDGSTATVSPFPEISGQFHLIRRSTKHSCYLVRADVGQEQEEWAGQYFLAIDRMGVIAVCHSEADLEELLSKPESREEYAVDFDDGPLPSHLALMAK
jgi:DNA invertase Pin-like site-specific DNA recombinase